VGSGVGVAVGAGVLVGAAVGVLVGRIADWMWIGSPRRDWAWTLSGRLVIVVDSKDTVSGAAAEPFGWAQPVNINSTARVPIQR
jgi:hypothetical protein